MDWMDKQNGTVVARADQPTVVRSQVPADIKIPDDLPAITPVANLTKDDAATARLQGDTQVRIVATIGTTPIYEREVREAVYQRLPELLSLQAFERKKKESEMFNEELRRMIERELILDELFAMLKDKKQSHALTQLKESATKEADGKLRDIKKRANIQSEEELKVFLHAQGLTLPGIRRHFERSFMMSAYLGERLKPKMNGISLVDVKDYYAEHGDQFATEDRVQWQDLFIRLDRFRSPEDAKKYAQWLLSRAQRGDDFVKLVNEFDMGISKTNHGFGYGEKRGEINPPELEAKILSMKQGDVAIEDFGSGYHIVRVSERTYAGKKPFDDKVQADIRRRLQGVVSEREYRKIVDNLWRRAQPQILVE